LSHPFFQENPMPDDKDPKVTPQQDQPQKNRTPEEAEQGTGSAQGGEIKDKDAETSNSYGNTRDSGERLK
jgi:hypothetical protein